MDTIKELEPVQINSGTIMRFFVDTSKPPISIDHHWTETTYDGAAETDVLAIPGHWHQYHDEFFEVLEGKFELTLDGRKTVVSAGDNPVHLPRGHVHGFTCFKGERATIKERTDPSGDFKELFFRDMFQSGLPGFWLTMRVFYDGDCYLALPGGVKSIDWAFITIVGGIAKAFLRPKPVKLVTQDKKEAVAEL